MQNLYLEPDYIRLESILKIINILAALGMQQERLTASARALPPSETSPCVRFYSVPRAAQASDLGAKKKTKSKMSAGEQTL